MNPHTPNHAEPRGAARVALVTGAASGLGAATARLLHERGWRVMLADLNTADAAALADQLGDGATAHPLDVADPEAWQALAADLSDTAGALHGLVNCAGFSLRKGIEETEVDEWQRVLGINLSSVFYAMKFCGPLLRVAGDASVVNISSIAGLLGYFSASYGATKWGVRGLSKTGAHEWATAGVRVNSVHPGLVDTPLLHSGLDNRFVDASLRSVPQGRVAEPAEVAAMIAWLLSDEARYVTGSEFVIDGGLTANGLYTRILADAASQQVVTP